MGGSKRRREGVKTPLQSICRSILGEISSHPGSESFLVVPSLDDFPDYRDVIKHPIDLKTISAKVDEGSYINLIQFKDDCELLFNNAMRYCSRDSEVCSLVYRAGS